MVSQKAIPPFYEKLPTLGSRSFWETGEIDLKEIVMNLPFFMSAMPVITLSLLGILIAVAIYLLKYKFKKYTLKKWMIIIALCWTVVAAIVILFYNIYLSIGRYQLNVKLAEMRKAGIPLDRNDIIPALPEKDAINGAIFYKAAYKLINTDDAIFKCAAEYGYDFTKWPDEKRQTFHQVLNSSNIENILNLFRHGAEKPNAVYNRDYQGFDTSLPELNPQRALFRIISLKSSLCGLDGKPEAGYSLIYDGFKTIKQLESEPYAISQLVNIACTAINIDAMNSLISNYGINSRTALQLMTGLDKLDFNAAMAHATDGEIMNGRDAFEKIISRQKTVNECFGGSSSLIEKYGLWPFIYQDYIWYLTYMSKNRSLFSQPYWLEEKQIEELNNELSRSNLLNLHCLISATIAMSPNFRIKTARIESGINVAKLTLALHIYKNQNGAFPDKLEQLAPGILKKIPVDPISGKPFEYRKTGGSFTLSSVWLKEKAEEHKKEQEKRNRNKSK